MKKSFWAALTVLLLVSMVRVPVLAGDINADEQRIINAISAVYEYDGAYYKVTDDYIAQVTAYLSEDGIDLLASEVDDYLSQFYANIATGISSGYMECLGKVESEKKPSKPKPDENKNEDGQNESSGNESNNNNENNSGDGNNESSTGSEEGTGIVIEGAIKVEELVGKTETSGDNTKGSTVSGAQAYTVADVEEQLMYVWDTDELTVHTKAYKDSAVIGTLLKGDEVIVNGAATTGWARIEYEGAEGFVSSAYLRTPGYMLENGYIEPETTQEETETTTEATSEEITSEEESTVAKDYSDAEPYQKGISLGMIAMIIVAVVAVAMIIVVLYHNNRRSHR